MSEPPLGWEIPELYKKARYDVGLINPHNDGSRTEVWWSSNIDMVKVIEAVTELLVMKETDPIAFAGNIVIRPASEIIIQRRTYNGGECEEDSNDSSGNSNRHLQSVGGDQSHDVSSADGTSYGYNRIKKALEEFISDKPTAVFQDDANPTILELERAINARRAREELDESPDVCIVQVNESSVPLTRHICTECGAAYHSDEEKATICNRCSLGLAHFTQEM